MIQAFDALCASGSPAALATIAAVEGSAYRRPGARMLVAADGRAWGAISGGCLDRDVARRARLVIDTGKPDVCCYESPRDPEDELRDPGASLGCGGRIDVFIEPVNRQSPGPLPVLARALKERLSASVATIVRIDPLTDVQRMTQFDGHDPVGNVGDPLIRQRILSEFSRHQSGAHLLRIKATNGAIADVLIERISPPQSLTIFGDGRDVAPLAEMARLLGWHVTVVGRSDSIAQTAEDAAAVVMAHDYRRDLAVLRQVLNHPPLYIGILGPRHRTRRLLAASGADWQSPDLARRLFWPIGLDVGAQSPQQIALAIVAEIQAVFAGRTGGHLRDRSGPIHGFDRRDSKAGTAWK